VQDFQRLQHDEFSKQAEALIPRLLAAARREGRSARWEYETLGRWDYVMRADEAAPLLFESWKRALSSVTLRRAERNEIARAIVGEGYWVDEWEEPDAPVRMFARLTGDSLMLVAMDTAMTRLRVRLGADSTKWRWGALHTAAFPHKAAAAFDLAAVARGGDGSTVNSTSGPDYRQVAGASYREILDVADWDRSVATSVPGQSGQPESEFYGNLLPLWARGEYFPLLYSRAAVERDTKHILWLKPAAPSASQ
jgi:penicillin amidase